MALSVMTVECELFIYLFICSLEVVIYKDLGPIHKNMQLVKHCLRKADCSQNVAVQYKFSSYKDLTSYCIVPLTVCYALTWMDKHSYIHT